MYRDKTLIPAEAVRLAALGMLAEAPRAYGDLAREVRHFASRIMGPSLDLLGPSLELLRHEGLVAAEGSGERSTTLLTINDNGLDELDMLLRANVRAPLDDLSKLVVALKMRFLDRLDAAGRRAQLDRLIELYDNEIARLADLRDNHRGASEHLAAWLGLEIAQTEARLAWLRDYRARI
jgi:DNA-binding PadR family transcriptional regulator